MATVRFVLRTDKQSKKGLCLVQLVYQIAGQRKYLKTKVRLHPFSWDQDTQQAVYVDRKSAKLQGVDIKLDLLPSAREVAEVNDTLATIRNDISGIEKRFELNGVEYSPGMVIDALRDKSSPKTKRDAPTDEVYSFIDKYILDHAGIREPGSLSVYRSLKNHLAAFERDRGRKLTFSNVDYSFFQDFQNYLITTRGLNNTTVAKQLSTIKTFLNYARIQGADVSTKYKDFKIKKESLEVIALTSSEFETLFHLDLSEKRKLAETRDVFCFACSTGLRYSDLQQLRREHIKGDELRLVVKKTKEPLTIPLTPYSLSILEKYYDRPSPLPVISNQKLNDNIRELCQYAGIDEPIEIVRFRGAKREAKVYPKYDLISVHTGRKTFATLSLEKGMSAEEVMTITGHKDYKSFKRYVKVTEQRKKVVMKNAWGEIKIPAMKVV